MRTSHAGPCNWPRNPTIGREAIRSRGDPDYHDASLEHRDNVDRALRGRRVPADTGALKGRRCHQRRRHARDREGDWSLRHDDRHAGGLRVQAYAGIPKVDIARASGVSLKTLYEYL